MKQAEYESIVAHMDEALTAYIEAIAVHARSCVALTVATNAQQVAMAGESEAWATYSKARAAFMAAKKPRGARKPKEEAKGE